jgi:hypothetical protein
MQDHRQTLHAACAGFRVKHKNFDAALGRSNSKDNSGVVNDKKAARDFFQ